MLELVGFWCHLSVLSNSSMMCPVDFSGFQWIQRPSRCQMVPPACSPAFITFQVPVGILTPSLPNDPNHHDSPWLHMATACYSDMDTTSRAVENCTPSGPAVPILEAVLDCHDIMRLSCGMALTAWDNWDSQSYPFWSILIPQKIQTTCPTCCLVTCGCSILGQAGAIVQVPMPHQAIQQPAVSWLVTTNNEHLDPVSQWSIPPI